MDGLRTIADKLNTVQGIVAAIIFLSGILWRAVTWRTRRRQKVSPEDRPITFSGRSRTMFVNQVWNERIVNGLDTLHFELPLSLRVAPELVERSHLQIPISDNGPIAIEKAFSASGEKLIIGGPAGSGKTTQALVLMRHLLSRARQDANAPIPELFPLASWAKTRQPILEWLADEIQERHGRPIGEGRYLIRSHRIVVVLDGLDEVDRQYRTRCLTEIETFRKEFGDGPLVLCTRIDTFNHLPHRLKFGGAVIVEPPAPRDVEDYLRSAGPQWTKVCDALAAAHAPKLRSMFSTPLMLTAAVLAYRSGDPTELLSDGMKLELRDRLWARYIAVMTARSYEELLRPSAAAYSEDQVVSWLGWIASRMRTNAESQLRLHELLGLFEARPNVRAGVRLFAGFGAGLATALVIRLVATAGYVFITNVGLLNAIHSPSRLYVKAQWYIVLVQGVTILIGLMILWAGLSVLRRSRWTVVTTVAMVGSLVAIVVDAPQVGFFSRYDHPWIRGALTCAIALGLLLLTRALWSAVAERSVRDLAPGLAGGLVGVVGGSLLQPLEGLVTHLTPSATPLPIISPGITFGRVEGAVIMLGALVGALVGLRVGAGRGPKPAYWTRRAQRGRSIGRPVAPAIFGLSAAIVAGLGYGIVVGVAIGLVVCVAVALAVGFVGFDSNRDLQIPSTPSHILVESARSGMAAGIVFGVVYGLGSGYYGPSFDVLQAIAAGVGAGLVFGINAVCVFWLCRVWMWKRGHSPLRLIRFLDWSCSRVFLRSTGSSYEWAHSELRDYFARRYERTSGRLGRRSGRQVARVSRFDKGGGITPRILAVTPLLIGVLFTTQGIRLSGSGTNISSTVADQWGTAVGDVLNDGGVQQRVDAVYALERIAGENHELSDATFAVLSAFVQQDDTLTNPGSRLGNAVNRDASGAPALRQDYEAIATVLTRHIDVSSVPLVLQDVDLQGATLKTPHFEGADLTGTVMIGGALCGASFERANLTGVTLNSSDLRQARFSGAVLSRTSMSFADLSGADFSGAKIGDLDLRGAVLDGVSGLTPSEIEMATRPRVPAANGYVGQNVRCTSVPVPP